MPTPLALLAVTSHAPTNDGLYLAANRIGALPDGFDSGLGHEDKTAAPRNDCKTRISHWMQPTLQQAMDGHGTTYAKHDRCAFDARKILYTYGYIAIKRPGTAQCYLIATRNKDGNALNGGKTYRLSAGPMVPVRK